MLKTCSRFLSFPLLFSFSLLIFARGALGQEAVLVKDINENPRAIVPDTACDVGSNRFLFLDDGQRGRELWFGDGFAGAIRLVKDIVSGPISGVNSNRCVAMNGVLYFIANDQITGDELWRSDGTAVGTFRVADINTGGEDSNPDDLLVIGSTLYFAATRAAEGRELWKTDGTEEGTTLVADILAGATGSFPTELTAINATSFLFAATGAGTGREIYISDGTTVGTTLLKDINLAALTSNPARFFRLGSRVLFEATTAAEGRELWASDGTSGGTNLVKDIRAGATNGTDLSTAEVLGSQLIFDGNAIGVGREPWITDGTPDGTSLLLDIFAGATGSSPTSFTPFQNRLFFIATNAASGTELWSTDGTPAGTVQQSEIAAGAEDGLSSYENLRPNADGSRLIFLGRSSATGSEQLYSTDGTPFSITKLLDVTPGSFATRFSGFGASLSVGVPITGPEPVDSLPPQTAFITDGTSAGTTIHPGTLSGFNAGSLPVMLGVLGGKTIFAADNGDNGYELWSTNGTSTGTTRLTDVNAGAAWTVLPRYNAAVLGGRLFFVASTEAAGIEPWVTDGTAEGTTILKDIQPGPESSIEASQQFLEIFRVLPSVSGGRVIFPATTTGEGKEPWISDGTTVGTTLLKDIQPGASSGLGEGGFDASVSTDGTRIYFAATDGANGQELWRSDGTNGGTVLLSDIVAGASGSSPRYLTNVPSLPKATIFSAGGANGREVWFHNGATTVEVADIRPGGVGSNPANFTFVSNPSVRVLFSANDGTNGDELWVSNGTGAGTSLVRDIATGGDSSGPSSIAAVNSSTVLFSACSGGPNDNCEPWKSDGTFAGTVQLKDIGPSSDSSYPFGFAPLGDTTSYFLAFVELGGYFWPRLFRTDLTEVGTVQLTGTGSEQFGIDLIPEFFFPYQPAGGDPTLLFFFPSISQGIELFKIGADECPSDPDKTSAGLCGCGVAEVDGDGDGAIDCLEQCPSDPLKSAPGICGCGVADVDTHGNGVIDCIDATLPGIKPKKPKVRSKGRRFRVRLEAREGTEFLVETRVFRRGGKKGAFKSRVRTSATFFIKKPASGRILQIRFRYQVIGDPTIQSAVSGITSK